MTAESDTSNVTVLRSANKKDASTNSVKCGQLEWPVRRELYAVDHMQLYQRCWRPSAVLFHSLVINFVYICSTGFEGNRYYSERNWCKERIHRWWRSECQVWRFYTCSSDCELVWILYFLLCDAMLAYAVIVCLSVCTSVRLSHAGIVPQEALLLHDTLCY